MQGKSMGDSKRGCSLSEVYLYIFQIRDVYNTGGIDAFVSGTHGTLELHGLPGLQSFNEIALSIFSSVPPCNRICLPRHITNI